MSIVFEREHLPYLCLRQKREDAVIYFGLFCKEDGTLSVDITDQGEGLFLAHGHCAGLWLSEGEDLEAILRFFERFKAYRKKLKG